MTKGDKKGDKNFIYGYLGEDISDGKSFDGKALNKEYDPKLDKSAYQAFWNQGVDPDLDIEEVKAQLNSGQSRRRKSGVV